MANKEVIHTKSLGGNKFRELCVYYDKGGMNYWNGRPKPKGIYFQSNVFTIESSNAGYHTRITKVGQERTDGYILVIPLTNYRPKALRQLAERVAHNADAIHTHLENGTTRELIALLEGCEPVAVAA